MQDSIPLLTDIVEAGDPDKKDLARESNTEAESSLDDLGIDLDSLGAPAQDEPAQNEMEFEIAPQESDPLEPLLIDDDEPDQEEDSSTHILVTLDERVDRAIEAAIPAIKAQLKRELMSQLSDD